MLLSLGNEIVAEQNMVCAACGLEAAGAGIQKTCLTPSVADIYFLQPFSGSSVSTRHPVFPVTCAVILEGQRHRKVPPSSQGHKATLMLSKGHSESQDRRGPATRPLT